MSSIDVKKRRLRYRAVGLPESLWVHMDNRWKLWLLRKVFRAVLIVAVIYSFLAIFLGILHRSYWLMVSAIIAIFGTPVALFVLHLFWIKWASLRTRRDIKNALTKNRVNWSENIRFPKGRLFYLLLGCLALMVLLALYRYLNTTAGLNDTSAFMIVFFVLSLIQSINSILCIRFPWSADSADKSLQIDPRRPVLFLRAFEDDYKAMSASKENIEEHLISLLSGIGPIIAVGRPGEILPKRGASRFYVPDAEWQTAVSNLVEISRFVLFLVGNSPGVMWEENLVLTRLKPGQILLHFGESSQRDEQEKRFTAFRDRQNMNLKNKLPQDIGTNQYLTFTDDWVPLLLDDEGLNALKARYRAQFLEEIIPSQDLRQFIIDEFGFISDISHFDTVLVKLVSLILYPRWHVLKSRIHCIVSSISSFLIIALVFAVSFFVTDSWSLRVGIISIYGISFWAWMKHCTCQIRRVRLREHRIEKNIMFPLTQIIDGNRESSISS